MGLSPREAYWESVILQADALELVRILYRGALEAVGNARRSLRAGDIVSRSRQITKANEILTELALSINRETCGEMAANLVELYDYMQRQLNEANFRQAEGPLEEVEKLLATLAQAWDACCPVNVRVAVPMVEEIAGRSFTY